MVRIAVLFLGFSALSQIGVLLLAWPALELGPGVPPSEAAALDAVRSSTDVKRLLSEARGSTGAARDVYLKRLANAEQELRASIVETADEGLQVSLQRLPPDLAVAVRSPDSGEVAESLDDLSAALEAYARAASGERFRVTLERDTDRKNWLVLLGGIGLVGFLSGAFVLGLSHVHQRREREHVMSLLAEGDSQDGLVARAARLKGRAERLAHRHDEVVLSQLSLAESVATYEAAQAKLFEAQKALVARLTDARGEIERLQVATMLDELTGALKYPYLVHRIRELLDDLLNRDVPFCLLELDLDNFKDINDTFGHAAGDDALREFSELLRSSVRDTDLVVRKSGDEFFVLAPETSLDAAVLLGESLRNAINSHRVVSVNAVGDRYEFPLAASIGVLDATRADLETLRRVSEPDLAVREIISYVDAALYRAKHAGKNCVRGYESGMRVVDLSSDESPPDLPRINRLVRSRYPNLDQDARHRFDALLSEASEMLFPRRSGP